MCLHGDKSQPERDWVLSGMYSLFLLKYSEQIVHQQFCLNHFGLNTLLVYIRGWQPAAHMNLPFSNSFQGTSVVHGGRNTSMLSFRKCNLSITKLSFHFYVYSSNSQFKFTLVMCKTHAVATHQLLYYIQLQISGTGTIPQHCYQPLTLTKFDFTFYMVGLDSNSPVILV